MLTPDLGAAAMTAALDKPALVLGGPCRPCGSSPPVEQEIGKVPGSELRALAGVEDLGRAEMRQRFLDGFDAEAALERAPQPPRQDQLNDALAVPSRLR